MASDISTIETGVDELLALLRTTDTISVNDAAQKLNVEQAVLQSWVDFLIEENVIGVEYKFITPYIFLAKKTPQTSLVQKKDPLEIKQEFYRQALERKIPLARVQALWSQYLSKNIFEIKDQFVAKGKSRGMDEQTIEKMWNKYKLYLLKGED